MSWLDRHLLLTRYSPKSLLPVWDSGKEEMWKGFYLPGSILHLLPLSRPLLLFWQQTLRSSCWEPFSLHLRCVKEIWSPVLGRVAWCHMLKLPEVPSAEGGELLRCAFPVSRLLGAHSHLHGWQQLTWWCFYTGMFMVYSSHTGAEPQQREKIFLPTSLHFRICLQISKHTAGAAAQLLLLS